MRLSLFDEKDRFVFSDRNIFETPLKKQNAAGAAYPQKLPAKYRLIDREEKWGIEHKDPLAVRQVEETGEEVIITTFERSEKVKKRQTAI